MKIEKFVKPKHCEIKYQKYLILLQNLDESCIKVTRYESGRHDYDNNYSIDYQKLGEKDELPLYFVIPQFYGRVGVNNGKKYFKNYLHVCDMSENLNVLNDYKKLVEVIIKKINQLSGKKYEINEDRFKFRIGQCIKEIPVAVVLKISRAVAAF